MLKILTIIRECSTCVSAHTCLIAMRSNLPDFSYQCSHLTAFPPRGVASVVVVYRDQIGQLTFWWISKHFAILDWNFRAFWITFGIFECWNSSIGEIKNIAEMAYIPRLQTFKTSWVSVEFLHAPIPQKRSGSTTTTRPRDISRHHSSGVILQKHHVVLEAIV